MSETKEQIYAQLHEWIDVTGVFPRGCSYEGEAESFIDQAFAAGEASASSAIATQSAQIEALTKALEEIEAADSEVIEGGAIRDAAGGIVDAFETEVVTGPCGKIARKALDTLSNTGKK